MEPRNLPPPGVGIPPEHLTLVGIDTRDGPTHPLWDASEHEDEDLALALGERGQDDSESVAVRMMNGRIEVVANAAVVRAARLWNDANPDKAIALRWHLAASPYEYHPLCKVFPALDATERNELRSSIERDGYDPTFPVVLFEGKILDGRNRYQCAIQCGAEPVFTEFVGDEDDALAFVVRANMARRHLTTSQRAAIAAEIATYQRAGRPPENTQDCGISQGDAAEMMNVSPRTVQMATAVRRADPELHEEVKRGSVTVSAAMRRLPPLRPEALAAMRPTAPPIRIAAQRGAAPPEVPPPRPKRPGLAEIRQARDDQAIPDDEFTWREFASWVLGERPEGLELKRP